MLENMPEDSISRRCFFFGPLLAGLVEHLPEVLKDIGKTSRI
jgi:hypothetical protein